MSTSIHFRFRNSIWIDNLWRERARNDAYYNNNTASAAFCREFSAPVHCALLKRRNNVNIISSRTTGKFNCRKKTAKFEWKIQRLLRPWSCFGLLLNVTTYQPFTVACWACWKKRKEKEVWCNRRGKRRVIVRSQLKHTWQPGVAWGNIRSRVCSLKFRKIRSKSSRVESVSETRKLVRKFTSPVWCNLYRFEIDQKKVTNESHLP